MLNTRQQFVLSPQSVLPREDRGCRVLGACPPPAHPATAWNTVGSPWESSRPFWPGQASHLPHLLTSCFWMLWICLGEQVSQPRSATKEHLNHDTDLRGLLLSAPANTSVSWSFVYLLETVSLLPVARVTRQNMTHQSNNCFGLNLRTRCIFGLFASDESWSSLTGMGGQDQLQGLLFLLRVN